MSEVYSSIMQGLREAIDDAEGEKKLKRTAYTIVPLKEYDPEDIKAIRKKTGLSQRALAGYMGISAKTVEAWEKGTNRPSGLASRLLNLLEMDPKFVTKYPFVKQG